MQIFRPDSPVCVAEKLRFGHLACLSQIRDQEPSVWSYFNQRWCRRPTKPQTRPGGPISHVWKEELSK
ncbi:hypothetical protein U9M48_039718 [Paspalum notatum var. saurae]|uniref:Uncharacterized protein n=1 Tax=Paspalum notatum var. saurae TaxID=547442 RepID=A0AAQ3XDF2_PASNO